ncbi:MAG: hypothetical protein AAGD07_03610 [Planctomycetota bacterium]
MQPERTKKCLVCGKGPPLNRGLCSTHHSRYYRQVKDLTPEQKTRYESELIRRGLLLPLQKPGPKVYEDPFQQVADELFAAESSEDYESNQPKKDAQGQARDDEEHDDKGKENDDDP